ncbi:MAG: hypothetical protein ACR2M1_05605 [Gemmatimonadaceae bacterium]
MATTLRGDVKVAREVEFIGERGKASVYIVTISREGVYMREKGKRKTFGPCPWSRVCWEAMKATDGMPPIPAPAKERPAARLRKGSQRANRNLLSL